MGVWVWCVVVVCVVREAMTQPPEETFADDPLDTRAKEGKHHYDLMTREAQMPRYGECYQNALRDLHEGCSDLTDEVQSRLALSFTNCYLVRFGWEVYPCGPQELLSACMQHLDSRAASVYSAMLSSTLAMCHFLQAQAWHHSTAQAINSLRDASEAVSFRLSQAADSAAALSHQLDAQITESRQAVRNAFIEIRESTAEQRGLIVDVFDRVAQLQTLVMGEFSWLYAVAFYVVGAIITMMATCTPRTLEARLPIFITLTISLLLERMVVSFILTYIHSDTPQSNIHAAVWMVRRLGVTCCCLLLMHSAVSYSDPVAVASAKLDELSSATKEIKKLINATGTLEVSSGALTTLSQVFDQSDSSDDTYDPEDDSDFEDDCLSFHSQPFQHVLGKAGGCEEGHYSLRPRPQEVQPRNPMLALETPEAFTRTVQRLETLARRRSRCQVWQYSRLSCTLDNSAIQGEAVVGPNLEQTTACLAVQGETVNSCITRGEAGTSGVMQGHINGAVTAVQ
ncbi:uncharacterized protein [Panulirus ornatus]|uniref:uncharacterized protein n=1 Tax=Panulirus ornatus TaxID=150431 RepID=UPI003A882DEC